MCACFLSLSSSLRCKLKKLNHRACPLQARATPDDEGQGEGKGSHDGSPRQVDDERLTLSHLNQLSRRLDRRGGHSFGNHASHGGAQRELSGHKARFVGQFQTLQTRVRVQTPITTLGHRSREHREQHAPSHVSPSLKHPHRRIRDALRVEKPRLARDFIHSTASIRSHARDRRRRAIARAQSHRTPRAHTRTYHPHPSFSRGVRYANARSRDDAPIARARSSVRDPETPPASSRARIAPSRDVPRRPRAHRRHARVSHASAPRAIAPRLHARRPRRRARLATACYRHPATHRIASHRIARARTLSARRTAAAGFTTLAEDFFAVVARARATVGRVVEAVTANMMGVVLYRCGARARAPVCGSRTTCIYAVQLIILNIFQYVVEPHRGWFWGLAINGV